MRYGVIADVHANLEALRVVVAELRRLGVDEFVVAGDLVGYGPHPNECVAEVASLGGWCVAGNHDLIALGELSDERCIPLARESLRWTREVLVEDARAFLRALPQQATTPDGIVVAHGSLGDPQRYTPDARAAVPQLARVGETIGDHAVLVLGHTHRPLAVGLHRGRLRAASTVAVPHAEPVLLNPGAVGQSRELRARARGLLLDLDRREARFLALRYDVESCRAALRRVGLSARGYHLPPGSRRVRYR